MRIFARERLVDFQSPERRLPAPQCAVQTMQGSKERITCCTEAAPRAMAFERRADERLLDRAGHAGSVARREIPGRRRDDLIARGSFPSVRRANVRATPRAASTRPTPSPSSSCGATTQKGSFNASAFAQPSAASATIASSMRRATTRAKTLEPRERASSARTSGWPGPPAARARRPPPDAREDVAPSQKSRRRAYRHRARCARVTALPGRRAYRRATRLRGSHARQAATARSQRDRTRPRSETAPASS